MGLAFIQSNGATSTAGAASIGVTYGSSPTSGHLLAALCYQSVPGGSGGTPTMAIADTPNGGASNTWTPVWGSVQALGLSNGGWLQAWVCLNSATGADTVTVTPSITTSRFTSLSILEVSGFPGSFTVDQMGTATITATGGTNIPEVDLITSGQNAVEAFFAMTQLGVTQIGAPVMTGAYTLGTQFGGSNNDFCAYALETSTGTYKYTGTCTALTAGTSASFAFSVAQPVVATTTFSPAAGSYSSPQTVTFNNTNSGASGFAMYYTTDGSTPTTGSTLYSGPITVSTTETVKVLAIATNYNNSAIASASYTITYSISGTTQPGCLVILTTISSSSPSDGYQNAGNTGTYSFGSLSAGVYQVSCQAAGWSFSPWSQSVTIVSTNIGNVNFTGTQLSGSPQVWQKRGVVLAPTTRQLNGGGDFSGVAEVSVLYEGNPQILTASKVFKMWFTGGDSTTNHNGIYYAESLDGVNWTQYQAAPIITSHCAGRVFKNGITYYGYWVNSTNDSGTAIDRYTSTDGVNWTLKNSAVLSVGSAGTWEANNIWGMQVIYIDGGGTWWAAYGGMGPAGAFQMGIASSPDGITWTKSASNPVLNNMTSQFIVQVGTTFYNWADATIYAQGGSAFQYPTIFMRSSSTNLTTWTTPVPSLANTLSFEGNGANFQLNQPALIEVNGWTYMYYSGTAAGASARTGFQIGLAIAPYTIAQLTAKASEAAVAPAFVQATPNYLLTASGTSYSATFNSNVTGGNLLMCQLYGGANGDAASAISDTMGNTWTQLYFDNSSLGNSTTQVWYTIAKNSGSDTVTVVTNTSAAGGVIAAEYTGVNTLDQNSKTNGSASTFATPSVTTTQPFELLMGTYADRSGSNTGAIEPSGATDAAARNAIYYISGINRYSSAFCDLYEYAAGSYSIGDITQSPSAQYIANISTFYNNVVATPQFNLSPGTYNAAFTTSVSDASSSLTGFAMYYTTDGSTPTTSSMSIANNGTIVISATTTIKVLAIATGYTNSAIATATYTIGSSPSAGWSPVDSRQAVQGFGPGPNAFRIVQGSDIYDVQVSDNPAVPGKDCRTQGAPVDCRITPNIPENSRVAPPFGEAGEP